MPASRGLPDPGVDPTSVVFHALVGGMPCRTGYIPQHIQSLSFVHGLIYSHANKPSVDPPSQI